MTVHPAVGPEKMVALRCVFAKVDNVYKVEKLGDFVGECLLLIEIRLPVVCTFIAGTCKQENSRFGLNFSDLADDFAESARKHIGTKAESVASHLMPSAERVGCLRLSINSLNYKNIYLLYYSIRIIINQYLQHIAEKAGYKGCAYKEIKKDG